MWLIVILRTRMTLAQQYDNFGLISMNMSCDAVIRCQLLTVICALLFEKTTKINLLKSTYSCFALYSFNLSSIISVAHFSEYLQTASAIEPATFWSL